MIDYEYSREMLPPPKDNYDIGYSLPPTEPLLNDEIEAVIGKKSIVRCDNGTCVISFDDELSSEEKTSLDQTVAAHKAAAAEG